MNEFQDVFNTVYYVCLKISNRTAVFHIGRSEMMLKFNNLNNFKSLKGLLLHPNIYSILPKFLILGSCVVTLLYLINPLYRIKVGICGIVAFPIKTRREKDWCFCSLFMESLLSIWFWWRFFFCMDTLEKSLSEEMHCIIM